MGLVSILFNKNTIKLASEYGDDAFKLCSGWMDKLVKFCMQDGVGKFVGVAGVASGVASIGTAGYSISEGQAKGDVFDIAKGGIDLFQEKHHLEGSDQSGTMYGTAGKIMQNLAIGIFNTALTAGQLTGRLKPAQLKILKRITQGLIGWQATTLADEFVRPDHGGFEDTVDKVGGAISVMGLARTLGHITRAVA